MNGNKMSGITPIHVFHDSRAFVIFAIHTVLNWILSVIHNVSSNLGLPILSGLSGLLW